MYFCRSWFLNMVSFRYVLVFLNFLHDTFSIKFYTISFLCKHNFFYWWETYAMNAGYQSKSISWKHFMFHEMTLKLYFMRCSERKISQCILPLRNENTKNEHAETKKNWRKSKRKRAISSNIYIVAGIIKIKRFQFLLSFKNFFLASY